MEVDEPIKGAGTDFSFCETVDEAARAQLRVASRKSQWLRAHIAAEESELREMQEQLKSIQDFNKEHRRKETNGLKATMRL